MVKRILIFIFLLSFIYADREPIYSCGLFPTGIISYKELKVTASSGNPKICGSLDVSAETYNDSDNLLKCSANKECSQLIQCNRIDPPVNKYDVNLSKSSKTLAWPGDLNLTDTDYQDKKFKDTNVVIYFNSTQKYDDSNRTYMTLGTLEFDNSNAELNFKDGDYYFEQFDFKDSNITINLPDSGSVRIFIAKKFNFDIGSLKVNGDKNNLFIFVKGSEFVINGNDSDDIDFKGYIYSKGDVKLLDTTENFTITGAVTAEGNLEIKSPYLKIVYLPPSHELGYINCPLCYAEEYKGKLINFFDFFNLEFDIPRRMAIINTGDRMLKDVNVTQVETSPSWFHQGSSELYEIARKSDENNTLDNSYKSNTPDDAPPPPVPPAKKHIENELTETITTPLGKQVINAPKVQSDNGVVFRGYPGTTIHSGIVNVDATLKTTAVIGDYNNTGFDDYYWLITYGIGATFKGKDNLDFYSTFVDENKTYKVKLGYCDLSTNKIKKNSLSGLYDAWDVDKNINQRDITTKIVNKEFNLTIASIGDDNKTLQKRDIDIRYNLKDMNSSALLTNWREFNSSQNAIKIDSFKISKAVKNVRVVFKVCSDYNGSKYTLYPYNDCSNTGDCNNNEEEKKCYRYILSSDNFAIRPDKFIITNLFSSQPLKAGEDFEINIKAVDYEGNATLDYNETLNTDSSPLVSSKIIKNSCYDGNISKVSGGLFKNGDTNATLRYSEVGEIRLKISEKVGSEFAKVDLHDTPYNQRLIASAEENLTFIPHHFDITAKYLNYKGGNFTYISNDLNMSSELNITVTAKNKQNKTTKNYNKACYAQKTDLNISYTQNGNINTLLLTKLIANGENRDKNFSINGLISENNLSKNIFNTDNNGSANIKIYINFKKNYSNPVSKFNMVINDINITDVNGTFGNKNLGENALFEYGKIDVKNVATIDKKEINTTIYYEYWDDNKGWIVNKEHNNPIYGDINETKTKKFLPSGISEFNLGNIKNGQQSVTIKINHSLPYSAKIHLSISSWLWYHPLAKEYKDPGSNNLDCLTHPCMRVEFRKENKGWGGVGNNSSKYKETNRTVEINASTIKIKANKTQVKKLDW